MQLRVASGDVWPRAELVFGTPCDVAPGKLGPVHRFAAGEVVAYLIRSRRRRRRLFVFRTLAVDDPLAALVPGVRPHVRLLFELHTASRIRLVRSLFVYLTRAGHDPSALPDGFYVRVGALLGGHLPAHKIAQSLLDRWSPKRAS